jgi:PAS domain-containing protein
MMASPVGISFLTDQTCQFISGNSTFLAQFESSTEDNVSASASNDDALGRQIRFFLDGRQISDKELPLQRAVAENRVIPSMELEVQLPSGRCWFTEAFGAPMHDPEGNVVGGVAVTLDVTERKQVEQEREQLLGDIQQERDRLSVLINSITDEVWFANSLKNFALINLSGRLEFNIRDDEVVNVEKLASNLEVYDSDGSPRQIENAPALRALNGEVVTNQEEIIRMPIDGELRYRQVNASPVRDQKGNIIGSIAVV